MKDWIVVYELEDGTRSNVVVPAVCRVGAWETFKCLASNSNWRVVAADCRLINW